MSVPAEPAAGITETAHDLGLELETVARQQADRPALRGPRGAVLTYGQLLSSARELAATLPAAQAHRPRPVALVLPHEPGTVIAMVAALLSNRPYYVLDPAQPRRRLEELVAAADPEHIWASADALRSRLRAIGHDASAPRASTGAQSEPRRGPAGLGGQCALYSTSGSSGTPKAVRYLHEATIHRARDYAAAIGATNADVFSLISPLWVAASASGLFAGLLSGAEVHLLAAPTLGPAALASEVAEGEITVWHSTPSLFRRLATAGALDGNRFRTIRLGGEPVLAGDIELARRICPAETLLVSGYSLTEANGAVTQKVVPLASPEALEADAGRALDGIELRIEGPDSEPLPAGEEGQIVLAGQLLSGGYASPESQSAGTHFTGNGDGRILRTGDRGILRGDGSLEVRGRDDGQLKIRGHRVDPVEVQAAALRHPQVAEVAIVPFTAASGTEAIALFAVETTGPGDLSASELTRHLEATLPQTARPAVVRVRRRLPLTPSGKVDSVRLTRLAREGESAGRSGPERLDPVVTHLLRLWRGALEVDQVGHDEDFFALGGDSLAAAEVCAGIEAVYGCSMEPATLLRHRTPRALGAHVHEVVAGTSLAAMPVLALNPGGSHPPLFAIPGAGSEATALVHFADALGADQPVNVIQLPGADGSSRPLTRMDEITAHCAAAIRDSGVEPPYRIAGTSFGGVVAYAVAADLLEGGTEVSYVGLFDTPAPFARRRNHLAEPLRRFRVPPGFSFGALLRSPRAELRRLRGPLRNLWVNYRLTLSLLLRLRWRPPPELRFRQLRAACLIAADSWSPPVATVPFHLYRCETQPDRLADFEYLGWEAQASDIVLRSIPTGHGGHIRPPGVRHLAALVDDDLA